MKENLGSVQCLRGLAAVTVALHHASDQIEGFETLYSDQGTFWVGRLLNTDVGAIGVDIFFMISGFIMSYTTYLKPSTTATQFLKRRFVRIYPLYWFFSLTVIVLQLTPFVPGRDVTFLEGLKTFALYPEFITYHGENVVRPAYLGQGWTLIYEVLFYLVFAAVIGFSPLRRLGWITAIFVGLGALAWVLFPQRPEGALLTDPIILEFSAGLLIGWAFCTEHIKLSTPTYRMLLLGGLALVVFWLLTHQWAADVPRVLRLGLPAFMIVGALILNPKAQSTHYPRFLRVLGDASYSIYLTHTIVLSLFRAGYFRLEFLRTMKFDLYFCILSIAILIAGVLAHFWVEKPLLRLFRKRV